MDALFDSIYVFMSRNFIFLCRHFYFKSLVIGFIIFMFGLHFSDQIKYSLIFSSIMSDELANFILFSLFLLLHSPCYRFSFYC